MDREELKLKAMKKYTRENKKDRRSQSEQFHKVKKKYNRNKDKKKWEQYVDPEEEYDE